MALVDCSRGIAALLVVFMHGTEFVEAPKNFGVDPLHGLFRFGNRGVDFFFVLSGFIITYVHWNDLGKTAKIVPYFIKRFIRVYITLWVVAVPSIMIALATNSTAIPLDWQGRIGAIIGSLTLVPTAWLPVPIVVWTLRHEIFFYAIFAVALWRPRWGAALMALGGVLCLYHATVGFASNYLVDFFLNAYNLEFLFGVACGVFMRRARVRFPLVVCFVGSCCSRPLRYSTNRRRARHHGPRILRRLGKSLSLA